MIKENKFLLYELKIVNRMKGGKNQELKTKNEN